MANIATAKVDDAEIDRLACECIEKAIQDRLLDFNTLYQFRTEERMKEYHDNLPVRGAFDPKPQFQLKFAMPQRMYHMLRTMAPDGRPDFDNNLEFMAWMKNNYPFMKPFELADKNWEDVAS